MSREGRENSGAQFSGNITKTAKDIDNELNQSAVRSTEVKEQQRAPEDSSFISFQRYLLFRYVYNQTLEFWTKCWMQPYPILSQTNPFKAVLICGIVAALLSASIRMSHTKLQCTDFYYKYCDLEDKDHYICYKHQQAYCCENEQIEDESKQLRNKHEQCSNLSNCQKMFISKRDRQCMEQVQFYEGVATFFYGIALVCLGGLVYLLIKHQRGREQWMQRMQEQQSYPANSVELQNLNEAPARQEPQVNVNENRGL